LTVCSFSPPDDAGLAIGDHDRIVDGLLFLAAGLLTRVAFEARAMVPELRRRRPRHTAIDRAAHPYLDLPPVRLPVAPGFAISEQRALRSDQQAGDAVDLHSIHPEREDVGLLEGLRR